MTALCPRCSAPLLTSEAKWLPAPDGYAPALRWRHERPDGGGVCVVYTGPPSLTEYRAGAGYGKIPGSDALSVPTVEAPGIAA